MDVNEERRQFQITALSFCPSSVPVDVSIASSHSGDANAGLFSISNSTASAANEICIRRFHSAGQPLAIPQTLYRQTKSEPAVLADSLRFTETPHTTAQTATFQTDPSAPLPANPLAATTTPNSGVGE